jgi:hypothetical protein
VPVAAENPGSSITTAGTNLRYLGNPSLWLRANDITSVANGAPITSWPDSTTFGNSATPFDINRAPRFQTNAVGSLPAVEFSGTGANADCLSIADNISVQPSVVTFAVMFIENGSDPSGYLVSRDYRNDGTWTAPFQTFGLSPLTSGTFDLSSRVTVGSSNEVTLSSVESTPLTIGLPYLVFFTSNGTLHALQRFNGASATASASGNLDYSGQLSTAVSPFVLGCASEANPNHFFRGSIVEIFMYSQALSAPERSEVANYLVAKYGSVF